MTDIPLERCLSAFYSWTDIDPTIITDEQREFARYVWTVAWLAAKADIQKHSSISGNPASQSSARGAPNSRLGESGSGWDLTTVREFVSSCERFIKNRWPLSKK
jgi:hypothetical protein